MTISIASDFSYAVIDGVQAYLWPFTTNWREAVDVNLVFNTDLITSRSGREQRRALRHTPRRQFQQTVTISQDEVRTLRRVLSTWQSRLWLMADPIRRGSCPDGAPAAATQVAVDGLQPWMAVGQIVMVGDVSMAVIDDIDINTYTLTFASALGDTVAPGTTIRPVLNGRISGNLDVKRATGEAAETRITFDVTPGSEPLDEGLPSYSILAGREVFLAKPNWGADVTDSFTWQSETLDFKFGAIATYNPVEFGTGIRQETFLCETSAEVDYLVQFFARQRGRRGEFLKPTGLNDLPIAADIVSGTTVLRVAGTHVATDFADDPIYQSIAVLLRNGTWLYREIESLEVVEDEDGSDSIINFEMAWASNIAVADVLMVCWMPVTRFSADTLSVQYITDQVAQVQLSTQTLEYLPAEDPLPVLNPVAMRFDSTLITFDSTAHTMDEA